MSSKKGQELDLPPTWEEMQAGQVSAPISEGWSTEELVTAWRRSEKAVRKAIRNQGWVCVGRRSGIGLSGQTIFTPIYAPKG